MLTVTPRFLAALRESHSISVAAYVYRPSALTTPIEVPVIGGSVTIDRDAQVRRQGSLDVTFRLADPFTVDVARELPYGGYCTIERGIRYADGTVERVQLGRFRVESIVWSQLQGQATLTLADRMAQIQDEPLGTPLAFPGTAPSNAAVQLVQLVFGSAIQYHVLTNPASEPPLTNTVYIDDRAAAINDLASSVGAAAMFDNLGDFVIRPRTAGTVPVWTIDAAARGVLIEASETLDRSSVRNGVLVRGQPDSEQAPIYSLATFDDPTSPIRWGGPFGHVALISDSTAVSTQAQADAAAQSLLNLRLGLSRTLTLTAVPNPALEPDDVIEVVFADGRSETQVVNAVQIGLDVEGALQITTTGRDQPPPV
ncbi:MAG TPA: DUF5047 domain-containing protein [Acidimicrobiales bacterium]|nr:DUF5047 domain-containing protein [Acidimicrobiales bacterium]